MSRAGGVYLHVKCTVRQGFLSCGYYTGHCEYGNGHWILKTLTRSDSAQTVKRFTTKEKALDVAKELLSLFPFIVCVSVLKTDDWISDVTRTGVQSEVLF